MKFKLTNGDLKDTQIYYLLYLPRTANATYDLLLKYGEIKGNVDSLEDHPRRASSNRTT
jgi:hypothetical protein